jgi:mannose-6-phosphate isomerase-like protein (cupin superfamily)
MTEPYVGKLKTEAKRNTYFRKVQFSARHSQLVLMSLRPGEEIGTEVHEVDQIIYIVEGEGRAVLDGRPQPIEDGMVVCVPAGVQHNVISSNRGALKLFTVYSPPAHAPETVDKTKADAEETYELMTRAPAATI